MEIAVNSFKNILKENIKMMTKSIIFFFSLVVIGVIAGFIAFLPIKHKVETCDESFINGCMAAGLSETACRMKIQ